MVETCRMEPEWTSSLDRAEPAATCTDDFKKALCTAMAGVENKTRVLQGRVLNIIKSMSPEDSAAVHTLAGLSTTFECLLG